MGIEFELKFSAEPEQQERIFRTFALDYQTVRMETTYYDTRDSKLSQRHVTLRRRMENGRSVCTVKAPAADGSRGEWECPCEDIHKGIEKLCKLGAPENLISLTQKGVNPVCGARFTRKALTLENHQGMVELALDRGILFAGDREIPLCEMEVELKEGTAGFAVGVAQMLAEKYDLQPETKSKFQRARALREES